MGSKAIEEGFFRFTSRLTRWFPRTGARILDGVFYPILSNGLLLRYFRNKNLKTLQGIRSFRRMLVIADIHIGDAILAETAVSALKDFFPEAQVDFAVKKSLEKLIEGHPDISQVWPVFTGGQFPNKSDIQGIQELSAEYDAVFNLCPFLEKKHFPKDGNVFHVTTHAPVFARNERRPGPPNHIAYQVHRFVYDILSLRFPIRRARPFESPRVFLSPAAIREAQQFVKALSLRGGEPVVFLNPDTASPFTRIPFHFQAELLKGLADMPCRILVGEGHTEKGIGERLLWQLPLLKRNRVKLVPAGFSLEAYTALIDHCDVFLSGDTGPLHLAAARKFDRNGRKPLGNRTAVFSVFGATPPRFSGYDSGPGFLESGQDAPARSYPSVSSCRNVTCVHKMAKVCDAKGCFESLDTGKILADIQSRLSELPAFKPAGVPAWNF
ncbi:MAG TPA: glycosyltransferase family 9 protein [bacterium]|nr:glycosyltransferase family 9 protein [bacterium]